MDEVLGFGFGIAVAVMTCSAIPDAAVSQLEYKAAQTLCLANEDVDRVRGSGIFTHTKITCTNGAKFTLDWDQLQKYKD